MKKEYQTPAAEKVEFDYTETVIACSNAETYNNALPGSGGWVCPCDQSSWWIDAATGQCNPNH